MVMGSVKLVTKKINRPLLTNFRLKEYQGFQRFSAMKLLTQTSKSNDVVSSKLRRFIASCCSHFLPINHGGSAVFTDQIHLLWVHLNVLIDENQLS